MLLNHRSRLHHLRNLHLPHKCRLLLQHKVHLRRLPPHREPLRLQPDIRHLYLRPFRHKQGKPTVFPRHRPLRTLTGYPHLRPCQRSTIPVHHAPLRQHREIPRHFPRAARRHLPHHHRHQRQPRPTAHPHRLLPRTGEHQPLLLRHPESHELSRQVCRTHHHRHPVHRHRHPLQRLPLPVHHTPHQRQSR